MQELVTTGKGGSKPASTETTVIVIYARAPHHLKVTTGTIRLLDLRLVSNKRGGVHVFFLLTTLQPVLVDSELL